MKKSEYVVPNETWLMEQFKDISFGVMRPSEMEILLAYFIIYHNGEDIEKSVDFISEKYKISESKAKRLKIEFTARYRTDTTKEEEIARIVADLFEKSGAPFEFSLEEKSVSFMVKDPWELKRIKLDLEERNIMYYGDFVPKVIRLSMENFACFLGFHYGSLEKQEKLKAVFNAKLDEEKKKDRELRKLFTPGDKAKDKVSKIGPAVLGKAIDLAVQFAAGVIMRGVTTNG